MKYTELKQIRDTSSFLPWKDRPKGFSEGMSILSKYTYSDFPNLHIDKQVSQVVDEEHFLILYGNVFEVLENGLLGNEARRLFELGWTIDDELDVLDDYFKFRL